MKRIFVLLVIAAAMAANSIASVAHASDPLYDCQYPGARVLLAKLEVARANGAPNRYTSAFASGTDSGLVCIDNHGATSGGVSINGSTVATPSDFSGAPALIGRYVALNPAGANKLIATISGPRDQAFSVRVYYATSPED
jgi:hypothetical protein